MVLALSFLVGASHSDCSIGSSGSSQSSNLEMVERKQHSAHFLRVSASVRPAFLKEKKGCRRRK